MNLKRTVHRLRYFVVDAWDELWHNLGINLLAVVTLSAVLFLAGFVMLVLANVENRVERLRQEVVVQVFLEDDLEEPGRVALQGELAAIDGVDRVDYVDKEEALVRYRRWASEMAELIDDLDSNPLPASFELVLAPAPDGESVGAEISRRLEGRSGVEEVRFNREWLRRLHSLVQMARAGGSALAFVVFAAVVFVIASVLRLAVYSRRDEIEIMLLVGASPAFVRGPFLVAAFGQGLFSSALALLIVEVARRLALIWAGTESLVLADLLVAAPLSIWSSMLLLGVGVTVSVVGAFFAVRGSLSPSS